MENRTADAILNDKAFDCMDKGTKEAFKNLYIGMQGKSQQESIPIIMAFLKTMPKNVSFTPEQKRAMLGVLFANSSEAEKNRLMSLIQLMGM